MAKKKSTPKPKRKPVKSKLKEDVAQIAYRTVQETIRRSES